MKSSLLDDLLDSSLGSPSSTSIPSSTSVLDMDFFDPSEESEESIQIIDLPQGTIDPRLKLLSHSSRTTLHSCPRKYQLYRLSSQEIALEEEKEVEQGVTFAYGSAVGIGIASVLEGKSEQQVLLDTFLGWDTDLLDDNPRQNKSFWLCFFAVRKFLEMRANNFLEDYETVMYKGKPAIELSFIIELPGGYKYRAFVDAVLRHKHTGDVMVLECKTTSGTAEPASYKNSGQAVGYSVVLDKLFPELSSYTVLYLVYESKSYAYKQLPFEKSLLQRALWLQELLIDTEIISLYQSYETFPLHGESCFDYFRDCEYLSLCTLSTNNLTKPLTQGVLDKLEEDEKRYDFVVTFEELLASQIDKAHT